MSEATISADRSRDSLLKIACLGVLTGILTPLLPALLDRISGTPGDLRIALVAVPFAILVLVLVRRCSANPWWAAWLAAILTMSAFVCAVNAAIFIDGQVAAATRAFRNILSGLAGGFVGAGIMALGIARLPSGPRRAVAWLPLLRTGTLAGVLLALDNALDLDMTSVLYPVWQAGAAIELARALRRGKRA